VDESAFKALVLRRRPQPLGQVEASRRKRSHRVPVAKGAVSTKASTRKPALLAGGNPQIAKGDGDSPVQAYIAAMPGWKRDVGRRLDALIVRTVPGVRKAVKWNSPFYGVAGQGWFLSVHCFTKYVKVVLPRHVAESLSPGESKQKDVRYLTSTSTTRWRRSWRPGSNKRPPSPAGTARANESPRRYGMAGACAPAPTTGRGWSPAGRAPSAGVR
jgi:hypothetical protein